MADDVAQRGRGCSEGAGMQNGSTRGTYLVAREAEDDEAAVLVLLVESLEALILGCEAAAQEGERK